MSLVESRAYEDPGEKIREELRILADVQVRYGSGPPSIVLTAPLGVLAELERNHHLRRRVLD